jgi:gamma-glutamylcyclotransferase (GGCT)/AIG2-like uncharacterized protein YtfP
MSRLFVYGTLKCGGRAHDLLERYNSQFLGEFTTDPNYHLYNLGWFPGMVIDEMIEGGVCGELYEVTKACLESMDQYEGHPHLFRRENIILCDGSTAIAYIYMQEFSGCPRVEEGKWAS